VRTTHNRKAPIMSYSFLTSEERYVISHLDLCGLSLREIGRRLLRYGISEQNSLAKTHSVSYVTARRVPFVINTETGFPSPGACRPVLFSRFISHYSRYPTHHLSGCCFTVHDACPLLDGCRRRIDTRDRFIRNRHKKKKDFNGRRKTKRD